MTSHYKDNGQLEAQAAAMVKFLRVFSDGILLDDIGPTLGCEECETLCTLLYCYGESLAAKTLREAHVRSDDEGDLKEHVELRRELGLPV